MHATCACGVEQGWWLFVPPTHVERPQAGSAQSISPLQSLSVMSPQLPASGPVGTQGTVVVVVRIVVVVVVIVVVVVAIVVVVVVVHMMCAWSQTPFGSQPAVVQGSLSVSGHGVLSGRFGNAQMPVIGLQTPGPVQGLLSSAQVVTIWFWSQPLTTVPPVASVPLHPDVVHRSLSVSVQGVLVGCGVCTQVPIV